MVTLDPALMLLSSSVLEWHRNAKYDHFKYNFEHVYTFLCMLNFKVCKSFLLSPNCVGSIESMNHEHLCHGTSINI
jgi:hypothetical protein